MCFYGCGMCRYNIVYRHTSFGSPGFFSFSSSFLLLSFRPSLPILFGSLLFGSFSLLLLVSDWFAVGAFVAIAVAMVEGRTGGVGNIILGSLRSIRSIRSKLCATAPPLLSSSCSGRYNAPLSKLFESRFCVCKWFRLPGKHNNDKMCPLIKSNEDDDAYTIYIWVTRTRTINGRTQFYLLLEEWNPSRKIQYAEKLSCAHDVFHQTVIDSDAHLLTHTIKFEKNSKLNTSKRMTISNRVHVQREWERDAQRCEFKWLVGWMYALFHPQKALWCELVWAIIVHFAATEGYTVQETEAHAYNAHSDTIDLTMECSLELYRTYDPCTMLFLAFVAPKWDVRGRLKMVLQTAKCTKWKESCFAEHFQNIVHGAST